MNCRIQLCRSPHHVSYLCRVVSHALLLTLAVTPLALGQQVVLDEESYLEPPNPILEQVTAPWHQNVRVSNLSPDGTKYLVTLSDGMVPLERLAVPYVILGELAVEPKAQRSRSLTTRSSAGYRIEQFADGTVVEVQLPEGARVSGARWSPDGSTIAFMMHQEDGTYLYAADTTTGEATQLCDRPLLATLVTSFGWSVDGKKISCVLRPEDAEMPTPSDVASEPKIRRTRNGENPSRTYRFLLDSTDDMALLEYLITGQLAVIDVTDGSVTNVGEPKMYSSNEMSPLGDFFRATTIQKPFSYVVPVSQFGNSQDLYDINGEILHNFSERKIGQRRGGGPTRGDSSGNGERVNEDKRDVRWRPDGKGLSFLQIEPKPEKEEDADDDSADADADGTSDDDASDDGDQDADADADDSDGEEGDDEDKPKRKDRVMLWVAPFGDEDVEVVYETEESIQQVQYSHDTKTIFLTQTIEDRRTITAVNLDDPTTSFVVYREKEKKDNGNGGAARGGNGNRRRGPNGNRGGNGNATTDDAKTDDTKTDDANTDDAKADDKTDDADQADKPRGASMGSLMTRSTAAGHSVVRISSDKHVFFSGTDSEDLKDDELPTVFVDKVNIESGEVTRVYESDGKMLEQMSSVDNDDVNKLFVTREMRDVVQDSYVIDVATGEEEKLTDNQNYAPWYAKLIVERFQVERVDGIKFWVTAYRNPDFGMQLPAMFWFYPREFDDQAAYDRSNERRDLPQFRERFGRPSTRSMTHLTQIGYVVVEPDCPIIGESGKWNDNFVPDLRNNLWAVIDAMDKKGWIDRDRLAIGGHSYGAFGTANALAHTPFFKAGIAGDGNYNRTLTPMSFQREPRSLWNAREVYTRMSPLFWTDQMNGALLMYHGIDDTNVGTWPIHSERMFQALDGTGNPASLYMYPYEGHGPIGRETQLDMWTRWIEWLDIYVKHPERGKALAEEKQESADDDDEWQGYGGFDGEPTDRNGNGDAFDLYGDDSANDDFYR